MRQTTKQCACDNAREEFCDYCIPFGPAPREERANAKRELERPHGLIPGQGDPNAAGMLVGEAGGATEHRTGRPFAGKAGAVLTTYCRAAGLPRPNLWITNVFPYWTGEGNPDPTPAQIEAEEWRLERDIATVKPRVIGAVGRVATRWFLGDVDISDVHGIPHFSDKAPGAVVVPITHPAAGFYEPERAAHSQDDIQRFAYYLLNPAPVRRPPNIKVVFKAEAPRFIRDAAVDTEGWEDTPWGLSWSYLNDPTGTSYVWIYGPEKRKPILKGFILFQNALHDLKILRSMGISTRLFTYGDTMLKLFNLQLEPQGLKAAAYRHLNLRMTSFDETVRPHFDALAHDWLQRASLLEYPKISPIAIADYTKRKNRIYSPQPAGRRLKNILTSYAKDQEKYAEGKAPEKPVRLEKRWSEIGATNFKRCGESEKIDNTDLYQAQVESRMDTPFPDFSIFCVPHEEAVAYSGTDAGATSLLDRALTPLIKAKSLTKIYEMDRACLPFVDRMQEVGMRVDVPKLHEFEAELEVLRTRSLERVQRVTGDRWFNPGSPAQVSRWLYSLKGLPVLNYTDSGAGSTSDAALQMLKGYHSHDKEAFEFVDATQDYREADKYLGTFVRPIFTYLKRDKHGDWRLHPNFRVTRVVSGRLSSTEPNVLALPSKTMLGRKIRDCFIARDGYILIDCDLSQIELRTMAEKSRDPKMFAAFLEDHDLHTLTAVAIFGKDEIAKDSLERYCAKIINFAVMYGISPKALLEQFYKSNIFTFKYEDCERFIRDWFRLYSGVRRYLNALWAQAAKDGYVTDMWGRVCYVPNIRLLDDRMREAAQRLCGNFPIQSGAHGLVKRAEVRVYNYIEETESREEMWPIVQMHDELLVEAKVERGEEVKQLLERAMTADQSRFRVPIKAEAKIGRSWLEAKG